MPEPLPLFPVLLPSVPFEERHKLPRVSGIYFALAVDGNVLYVGATRNLRQRWIAHHHVTELQEMACVSIAYYACPVERLNETESAMILTFQPQLNSATRHGYDRPWHSEPTKEPMTITLTPEGKRLWAALAKLGGVSRSAILERLLREEAERKALEIQRTNDQELRAITNRELSDGPPNSIIHPK